VNQKIEYGTSIKGTANDIAFALATMKQAGFEIRQPVGVDLQEVACRVLGIDGDDDVEQVVSDLARAIDESSVSMPVPPMLPMGMTRAPGKFDIGATLALTAMQPTLTLGTSEKAASMLDKILPADQLALQAWTEQQTPGEYGSIDLMRWPGWAEAIQAKLRSKT